MKQGIIHQTPIGWTITYTDLRPEVTDPESGCIILPSKMITLEIPIAIKDQLLCKEGKEAYFFIETSGNLSYARIKNRNVIDSMNRIFDSGYRFYITNELMHIDGEWENRIVWIHANRTSSIHIASSPLEGFSTFEEAVEDCEHYLDNLKMKENETKNKS